MKNKSNIVLSFILFIVLTGCYYNTQQVVDKPQDVPMLEPPAPPPPVDKKAITRSSSKIEDEAGYKIRPLDIKIKAGKPYLPVGAEIISKHGKVSLTHVIKQMLDLKGLSVSWADDVDQAKLVDCDIKPEDNFWDALDNILRQVDYFYETQEDTVIVKYKETKKYHLSMPNITETFQSTLGGNMLPSTGTEGSSGLQASATLTANSPELDFWKNIEDALKQIVSCDGCPPPVIEKSLGLITISAPQRIHKDVDSYLSSIKKEAYKQVIIEAKILEVILTEDHETGIDWSSVFSSNAGGGFNFQVNNPSNILYKGGLKVAEYLSNITLAAPLNWNVALDAFSEYGDTSILANPKLHLLNGHSAVLNAGQEIVYLSGCAVTESDAGNRSSEPETSSVHLGLAIGLKANIISTEEVILYVFPALTRGNLVNVGAATLCGQIQAPQINVREMATHARVRDGEILIIGGLIDKQDIITRNKIPLLGDIPLIGKLFRHEDIDKQTTELVIMLRPKIVTGGHLIESKTQ